MQDLLDVREGITILNGLLVQLSQVCRPPRPTTFVHNWKKWRSPGAYGGFHQALLQPFVDLLLQVILLVWVQQSHLGFIQYI